MPDPLEPTTDEVEIARKMIAASAKEKGGRSLDDEREFMENLLVQRLNFLLIVFSIFVGAGCTARTSLLAGIIFSVGFTICFLMAGIVHRAHVKHHWILKLLYAQKDPIPQTGLLHVVRFINNAMGETAERKREAKGTVSRRVGRHIPRVCWASLLAAALFSFALAIGTPDSLPVRLRAILAGPQSKVVFSDSSGQSTELEGRASYTLLGERTVEMTVMQTNGKTTVVILPLDKLVRIER